MARGGVSGLAVALAAAGGYLVYAGLNDVPLTDGLRSLLRGQLPAGTPAKASATIAPAGVIGANAGVSPIEQAARKYLGVPYKWGAHGMQTSGQFKGRMAFDCSGFVTWVLHHDLGIKLPNNTHTVSGQFMTWGGAAKVPRSTARSGDLVCYVGHVGIAVNATEMINAPHAGAVVRVQKIWGSPVIRRIV